MGLVRRHMRSPCGPKPKCRFDSIFWFGSTILFSVPSLVDQHRLRPGMCHCWGSLVFLAFDMVEHRSTDIFQSNFEAVLCSHVFHGLCQLWPWLGGEFSVAVHRSVCAIM